jgi:TRAP-type C4-dicarboxylate transport system substrate-binding protein
MKLVALLKVLVVFAFMVPPNVAAAQDIQLIFDTTLPAGGLSSRDIVAPWVARVNEAAKGMVTVVQRDGANIATMANSYDRVQSDVVQIAWGLQPLLGGKFPLSEVAGLPLMLDSTEKASAALWRLYKTGLLEAEYKDIVPLWLIPSAPNKLHFAKAPASALDLKGQKVNVFDRVLGSLVAELGGAAVSVPPEQQYESLLRGTMSVSVNPWSGLFAYNQQEVTTYHSVVSLGAPIHMFFMARKKFDSLPAAARKIIEDNSGEVQGRIHGKYWDDLEGTMRTRLEGDGKHRIVTPTAAELADLKVKTDVVIENWAKSRPGGEKVLATYRQILTDVSAAK